MAKSKVNLGSLVALLLTLALAGCGGGSTTPLVPGFTLSASPSSPNVGLGGSATSLITVNAVNGFNSSVTLSASGLPNGVTASFNPPSTTSTTMLTLTASGTATLGSSAVTATGTAGMLTETAPINLTVAPPSVTVTLSPKLAAVVTTTQTQQFNPTVTGNMGNPGVTWTVDSIANGNAAVGTISASGLYTPPATAGSHTVTATSVVLPSASGNASIAVSNLPGVFTYHNDLARDGANSQEYALKPSTVNTTTFGKLFSCATASSSEIQAGQGAVYTQPLWVPGMNIGGAVHNVIFVATQHDTVFAFDADASPCVTYWKVNLLDTLHGATAGETPIIWNDVGSCFGDIYPEVGVTGTPVIDPTTSTIYLVSASESGTAGGNCSYSPGTFYRRLHALDLATGNEKFNGPVNIAASVPGVGDGGTMVTFDPQKHNQRSGLALSGGAVYVSFAAHEDATPYHGWVFGYSASDLQQPPSLFNTTPNGGLGGIWAGGGAPAVDAGGDVYVATGNGIFDEAPPPPSNDYGDSVLRLHPFSGTTLNGVNLNLVDWFTPFDQLCLANNDTDLGSGNPVLLPNQTAGPLPNLLVQLGKDGIIYLIDRDMMGHYAGQPNCTGSNSQIVQSFSATSVGLWGTVAFWQNGIYFAGAYDSLKRFAFDPATGQFNPAVASQTASGFPFPGASPSISSQGASSGVVWAIDAGLYGYASGNAGGTNCSQVPVPAACSGPAILRAYDATNLATELWDSTQAASNRDQAGNAVKFAPPTIANGKVYVSTRTEIDVYGLLPN